MAGAPCSPGSGRCGIDGRCGRIRWASGASSATPTWRVRPPTRMCSRPTPPRPSPAWSACSAGRSPAWIPPEHHRLRRLISQSFTPKRVAGLAPRIAEIATTLLDQASGSDRLDLVSQFAYPLPVTVIAELLGVPIADRELFHRWADYLLSVPRTDFKSEGFMRIVEEALREMDDYLLRQCLERRKSPRDDLISDLVTAEVDGQRLDDEQLVNFSRLLLLAGHITTTLLLGNTMLCLQESPHAAAELRADRSLIPGALEEVLRFRSPFPQIARVTTRDVELSGQGIPSGQLVLLWLLSANHDERRFAEPERFDIHRDPNEQLAFGHGVHFCLGAPLARLEGKIAVDLLLTRFADIRVTPGARIEYYENVVGPKALPVTVRRT